MPTSCHRKDCDNDAHVLLFATGHQFLGQAVDPGQAVYLCLAHGGQVYDMIRAWRDHHTVTAPSWLVDDVKNDRLPTILPVERWTVRAKARTRRPPVGKRS
jgi:hypothetical protein